MDSKHECQIQDLVPDSGKSFLQDGQSHSGGQSAPAASLAGAAKNSQTGAASASQQAQPKSELEKAKARCGDGSVIRLATTDGSEKYDCTTNKVGENVGDNNVRM